MRRVLLAAACALAVLGALPAHGSGALTTVKGPSQFSLDRPSQDPLQYDKLTLTFSDVRSQSVAEYPPVGLGTATLAFVDFAGRTTSIPLTVYAMTVTDAPAGAKHVAFSGLGTDNRCFTGAVTTGSRATVQIAFGALPCDTLATSFNGTGTTSYSFTQTG